MGDMFLTLTSFKAVVLKFSQVENENRTVRSTCTNFISLRVPAHLEYPASSSIAVHQLAALCAPDVNTFIKAARRKEFTVGAKCNRINRLRVFRQRVDWSSSLNIPQANGGIETGAGQNQIHVGIRRSRTSRWPFDGINFLRMCLKIVHKSVVRHWPDFKRHVVGAGSQKLTLRVPFDCVYFVLQRIVN